ncbi:MAG: hypothetical protein WEB33_13395 [Bacteroidota bacterium]
MKQNIERDFLKHFLAAIAYRTQKAVRDAPREYWDFSAGNKARTPSEVLRHMTSVLGYARTFMIGGQYPIHPDPLPNADEEINRFHGVLEDMGRLLAEGTPLKEITERQLLQGPLSDVMTHAGQLALLRRLHGSPVPPENFIFADIAPERLGRNQSAPHRPDKDWPEKLD